MSRIIRFIIPLTPNSRSYLNQFTQPDSIIPQQYDPQSWNRYEYAEDNPVRYNDPTGHRNCDEDGYCPGNTYDPDVARQDMLFTRMFRGSGSNSAWTYKDWQYYDAHRNDLWRHPDQWINPDPEKGWNLFALHAKRLASYYSPDQQSDFVRDFCISFRWSSLQSWSDCRSSSLIARSCRY